MYDRAIEVKQIGGTALIVDPAALRTSEKIEERLWFGRRAAGVDRGNWVALEAVGVLQQSKGTALFVDTATL